MRRALLALACLALPGQTLAECSVDRVTVEGGFGTAAFAVVVADEPAERSRGLMFVEEMPRFAGMLFVYEQPVHATFWMQNTLIPLDMLFANEAGVITHIHHEAVPLDTTTIDGGRDVEFVLEINGGMAEMLGIAEGDMLQHPSIGEDAALPCG